MKSVKESLNSEKAEAHKFPNTVRFDEEELPELKSWKVGGKYKITLEVEQTSMSKGDEFGEHDAKPLTRASFKILSVSPLGGRNTDNPKRPSLLSEAMKKRI